MNIHKNAIRIYEETKIETKHIPIKQTIKNAKINKTIRSFEIHNSLQRKKNTRRLILL